MLVTVLTFVAVSALAIWEDGIRFARVRTQHSPAANGIAAPSYLDASRFYWKTADELHEYAREHRLELARRIEGRPTP
jgi:hypothetical protein